VRIEHVTKKFADVTAVNDVSLDIFQGEFFSLLGSSGCGKSTLLRMLAGLERPTQGRIYIDGADMTDLPPYSRPVNMMFQSYALFPHMTVEQNVEFGLKQDCLPRRERAERVREMLDLLQIGALRRRTPDQISGGQLLRESAQFELVNLQERLGLTFITVTHDQEEAMTMSTRIAVMNAGQILQVDTPTAIYEYPEYRFVADFIGLVNLFEGRVAETLDDQVLVETSMGRRLHMRCAHPHAVGTPVTVAIRPEKVQLCQGYREDGTNQVKGVVEDIAYLGDVSIYRVRVSPETLVEMTLTNVQPRTEQVLTWGQEVAMEWSPTSGVVLTE
jgi:putrescine transport system ATP-binding protein